MKACTNQKLSDFIEMASAHWPNITKPEIKERCIRETIRHFGVVWSVPFRGGVLKIDTEIFEDGFYWTITDNLDFYYSEVRDNPISDIDRCAEFTNHLNRLNKWSK